MCFDTEKNIKLNKLYSLNFPDLNLENLVTKITKVDYSNIPNQDL